MKTKASILVILTTLVIASFAAMATAQSKPIIGMAAHTTEGITCEDCHATDNVVDSCLSCHANSDGYYRGEQLDSSGNGIEKAYPEAGKTKMAAMHDSHGGKIRCTVCHTSHKEPEQLYCNHCHQFNVKIK